jgi:hypothetical protein
MKSLPGEKKLRSAMPGRPVALPATWKQLLDLMQLPVKPPEAYNSPFGMAILHPQPGEKSKAELAAEPTFDAIRSEPRFPVLEGTTEKN